MSELFSLKSIRSLKMFGLKTEVLVVQDRNKDSIIAENSSFSLPPKILFLSVFRLALFCFC